MIFVQPCAPKEAYSRHIGSSRRSYQFSYSSAPLRGANERKESVSVSRLLSVLSKGVFRQRPRPRARAELALHLA